MLELAARADELALTADELLRRYCRHAYRRTRSFDRAARMLQLDRRTVRAKVDEARMFGRRLGRVDEPDDQAVGDGDSDGAFRCTDDGAAEDGKVDG